MKLTDVTPYPPKPVLLSDLDGPCYFVVGGKFFHLATDRTITKLHALTISLTTVGPNVEVTPVRIDGIDYGLLT